MKQRGESDAGHGARGADGGNRPEAVSKAINCADVRTARSRADAEEVTPRVAPPGDKGGPTGCGGNDADPSPAVRTGGSPYRRRSALLRSSVILASP